MWLNLIHLRISLLLVPKSEPYHKSNFESFTSFPAISKFPLMELEAAPSSATSKFSSLYTRIAGQDFLKRVVSKFNFYYF